MATFGLPRLSLLVVMVVITLLIAVLTSSVNAVTADTSPTPSTPASNPPSEPPSPTVYKPPDTTGGKKASRYSSMAEGGPISMSTYGRVEATSESNKPDEARTRENAPKERYASRTGSVVARKGVQEKIKARKGVQQDDIETTKTVDQNMEGRIEKEHVSLNQTTSENTKPIMENSPAIEIAHIKSETSNVSNPKLNATDPRSDGSSTTHNTGINFNASVVLANGTVSHSETNNTAPKHIEKHIPKPKPTVTTVDGPEINESIPVSRTKNPPLGMPRKIDYIMPVIITIVALPILGAVIFVLYRRGRDCWDKRHYRRMDFLIDGMYND